MKHLAPTLALLAALLALSLGGCCHDSTGWGWYEPCDLIEGRAARACDPCRTPCYQPGQVVSRSIAVPVQKAPSEAVMVAPAPAPDEAAPPAGE